MVFPVVMYGYENWSIKKAECQRMDAFELWCWRKVLRIPWTARRSNQSILKGISPEYSLEELMLKLKLQYFGPPDAKNWLIWKDLILGKIEGRRRRAWQRMRWFDGITDSMNMSLSGLWQLVWTGRPGMLQSLGPQESDKTEQLNWVQSSEVDTLQRYHTILMSTLGTFKIYFSLHTVYC